MIPPFNHSHVLPPFLGDSPVASAQNSPYTCSALELVQRFAVNQSRCQLLEKWLKYRAALRGLGFCKGFQWIDGSFTEDVETQAQREPADVDVVTFAFSPEGQTTDQTNAMLAAHPDIFDRARCKAVYGCDTFLVPLDKSPESLVKRTAYYLQLFSHRRSDQVWKGFLQIPLESDDAAALQMLHNLNSGETHVSPA